MDPIDFTIDGETFHVEGYPNAEKLILLKDKLSLRLAALALHRSDLKFANECLGNIPPDTEVGDTAQQGLWIVTVAIFIKCFQSSESRMALNPQKVFKNDKDALDAFEYYQNLRNKHYIHDVNSMHQSIPFAVLNKRGENTKIAKIITSSATGYVSIKEARHNLTNLLGLTIQWLTLEYDKIADLITAELEAKEYDELLVMESPVYKKPGIGDIAHNRLSD